MRAAGSGWLAVLVRNMPYVVGVERLGGQWGKEDGRHSVYEETIWGCLCGRKAQREAGGCSLTVREWESRERGRGSEWRQQTEDSCLSGRNSLWKGNEFLFFSFWHPLPFLFISDDGMSLCQGYWWRKRSVLHTRRRNKQVGSIHYSKTLFFYTFSFSNYSFSTCNY